MSMLGICELVAVAILLLCNCLNLMNVFGVFDGHQVRPIASLANLVDLFTSKIDSSVFVNDEFATFNSDTYNFSPSTISFDLTQEKQPDGNIDLIPD